MISLINSQSGFPNIRTLMNEGKGAELDSTAQVAASPDSVQPLAANSASSSPASMMSRNFVHFGDNQSKYQEAREKGKAALLQQANRQKAILARAMAEVNALSEEDQQNYAMRSYIGRKAARRMLEEKERATRESSERNLKEMKEEIERRAKEAMEKGGQHAVISEDGTLQPAENDTAVQEMPEIASGGSSSADVTVSPDIPLPGTGGSPAVDVAPAPAPDVAISVGSGSTSAEPATPSINIVV